MATARRSITSSTARPSRPRRGRALLTAVALLAPGLATAAAVASPASAVVPTIVVSVGDRSIVEGDGGPADVARFPVGLSAPAVTPIYVWFHTVDGSATTDDGDYASKQAGKAKLKLAAGATAGNITIPVYGDTNVEGDETFTVVIDKVSTTPTGAADPAYELARNVGTGTIVDDDPAESASLSIGAVAIPEGNGDIRKGSVGLRLSQPMSTNEFVYFHTEAESATSGQDFTAKNTKSRVLIPKGKTVGAINITALPDNENEGDETYRIVIDKVTPTYNGSQDPAITITDPIGEVTILDDDVPPTAPGSPTNVHAAFDHFDVLVDVTWTAPADTGGRAVTYLVERSNDFGGTWVPWATVTATTAHVTCGFTGDYCIFRVSAHNSAGDSEPTNQIDGPLWNCHDPSCLI